MKCVSEFDTGTIIAPEKAGICVIFFLSSTKTYAVLFTLCMLGNFACFFVFCGFFFF